MNMITSPTAGRNPGTPYSLPGVAAILRPITRPTWAINDPVLDERLVGHVQDANSSWWRVRYYGARWEMYIPFTGQWLPC